MKQRTGQFRVVVLALCVFAGVFSVSSASAAVFAKYDGVDGESKDGKHDKWIDVLSVDWGATSKPAGMTGATRRRGGAVVEDMTMTLEYEKAAPMLQEKCLNGEVIPKLEIDLTSTYGGARATYLAYELKNVMITSYHMSVGEKGKATVVVSVNFEEIKVTYMELDSSGRLKGSIETQWSAARGASPR